MPLDWPQTADQGATWEFYLDVTDGGVPATARLTGATAKLQVRSARSETVATSALIALTSSPAAGISINTSTGRITCTASSAQVANCPTGKALPYGLLLTESGGRKTFLIESDVTFRPTSVKE